MLFHENLYEMTNCSLDHYDIMYRYAFSEDNPRILHTLGNKLLNIFFYIFADVVSTFKNNYF